MNVIEMIDTLNSNSNVGRLGIRPSSNHQWNSEIVELIISKYTNVYDIVVLDYNNSVDHWMHDWIKQYV